MFNLRISFVSYFGPSILSREGFSDTRLELIDKTLEGDLMLGISSILLAISILSRVVLFVDGLD